MNKIGLIAGNGNFPVAFARAAREKGIQVIAVAHDGETSPELAEWVDGIFWIKVGQLGKIITILREQGVRDVLMAGGIKKTRLYGDSMPDARAVAMFAKMSHKKDDSILRAVARELESEGITVRESTLFLDNIVAMPGILTKRTPTTEERRDIEFGWQMAKEVGRLDIGQTVVVKDQAVLAVEAIEGTDEAIRRGGLLCGQGAIVVKVCKPQQDLRFDLPAVGVRTIETMEQVKASCLAVEAGRTIVIEQDDVIRCAERAGISIIALNDPKELG